ncbi:MAG: UvrD-helicase domain-containing protein [Polyangiales bacterium]
MSSDAVVTGGLGLNPEQLAAVEHSAGPLVVFAGAGSGKTRVITHRVAHLIDAHHVPPYRILAVTFTNKAARELRERLERLAPGQASSLWVGTFHAVCARLLRAHSAQIELRKDFVIYDDADQKSMLARVITGLELDERMFAPKAVQYQINTAKQEGKSPDDYEVRDPFTRTVREIYAEYEQRMAAASALDFGDLIYRLVRELRTRPELREALRARFQHVLVDEFQDVNHVQFAFVEALCEQHRNLCVVGDDDQSIYRWRGADRRNILEFRQHFPDATVIKLEQNYRSTQRILRAANAVVAHNLEREPKRLWTENDEGSPVTVIACDDDRDEANTVVQAILMLCDNGYARKDIALLYRTHAQSRVFEEGLRRSNLPYRVIGGLRFYDRAEVKDLLAYMRAVHNVDDDVSLSRIINKPARGIGKTTIDRMIAAAQSGKTSLYGALLALRDDPSQAAALRKKLGAFVELLDKLREVAPRGPASLAREVLRSTGYVEQLRAEDTPEADTRIENITEVLTSMDQYEADASEPTLTEFLELVTLETDADRTAVDDSLTLMTVHAAKGLEFPVVFVAGLEEETFPSHRGYAGEEDPDELEEERRLAYVAFTRARERLFLSHANLRRVYTDVKIRRRSRFIDEIPREELTLVGGKRPAPSSSQRSAGSWQSGGSSRAVSPSRHAPAAPSRPARSASDGPYIDRSEANDTLDGGIALGMRVQHTKFGIGRVTAVADGVPPRVTVAFPDGSRSIISSFLTPV